MSKHLRSDSTPLFDDQPELYEIWSENNNSSIDMGAITKWQASTKYLWVCPAGHEYWATPRYISNDQRCPYCAGKQVLEGFNDLACVEPDKAELYDKKRNTLSPHEIMYGSSKRVAWKCSEGHTWNQSPRQFKLNSGCPVCKKRIIVTGQNDLATTHPELALEYASTNSIPANNIGSNTTMRADWVCQVGHTWSAVIRERVGGKGCPVCSNNLILPGVNDFATEHPELVGEWDFELNQKQPDEIASGSGQQAHWVCGLGHKWTTPVFRRSNGRGCIYCANRAVWPGFNDLESRFPIIAAEWDYKKNALRPDEVLFGSNLQANFKCSEGHSYKTKIGRRTLSGSGCPVCLGFEVQRGVNDLLSQRPKLAARWSNKNETTPDRVYKNSAKMKYIFECEHGHEYRVAPQSASDEYCPTCSNKEFEPGFNDLKTVNKSLALEFVSAGEETNPRMVPSWSTIRANWKCYLGHTWVAAVRDRVLGHNCPYCGFKRVWTGFNDLAKMYPEAAEEWDYQKNQQVPEKVIAHSPKKFWWLCKLGHSYEQSLRNKVVKSHGCSICSNRKLLVGFNDLEFRFPELASEWHSEKNQQSPHEIIFGSPNKVWWKCSAGHEWQAAPATRVRGIGCQSCNSGGFNPAAPANVYFLIHEALGARKVGIRGVDSSRLRNFELTGWSCLKEFVFDKGVKARAIEKDFFIWLRKEAGLPAYLGSEDMHPFGGATETFSIDGPSNYEIEKKIEEIISHYQ